MSWEPPTLQKLTTPKVINHLINSIKMPLSNSTYF